LAEVAPLDIVRKANGVVSAKRENNVKDGTPGGSDKSACSETMWIAAMVRRSSIQHLASIIGSGSE
jgi:hypothetical protein